jgi:flagellar hook assembly protein FlgD
MYNTLGNVFAALNCALVGQPINTTDTPNNGDGSLFVNFMNLKNNPLVSGYATVNFGLAKDDFVQVKVFDVSGRLVRTLADRKFAAGEHSLVWDGVDNAGHQLPRGVYFTQLRYRESGFELAKKLTILR